jgi:phage FluMu protein Com
MAKIKASCHNCGSVVSMAVKQYLEEKRIFWSAGYSCPRCKHQVELDDQGETPPEIRQAILDQEGIWSLIISEKENKTKVMMALRTALGLSMSFCWSQQIKQA